MTKSILLVGVAIATLIGSTSIASAEVCIPEAARMDVQHEVVNEESRTPARVRFEIHFASLSADTGSRIQSDGANMARPVRVVSADEFKLDWRR